MVFQLFYTQLYTYYPPYLVFRFLFRFLLDTLEKTLLSRCHHLLEGLRVAMFHEASRSLIRDLSCSQRFARFHRGFAKFHRRSERCHRGFLRLHLGFTKVWERFLEVLPTAPHVKIFYQDGHNIDQGRLTRSSFAANTLFFLPLTAKLRNGSK